MEIRLIELISLKFLTTFSDNHIKFLCQQWELQLNQIVIMRKGSLHFLYGAVSKDESHELTK